MRAPVLNRKLVLEAPVLTPDGAGGYQTTWSPIGTVWAEMRPGAGRAAGAVAAPLSRVPMRIIVRAAPQGAAARPLPGQRLRDDARLFAILAVTEADRSGRYLTLHAEEETVR